MPTPASMGSTASPSTLWACPRPDPTLAPIADDEAHHRPTDPCGMAPDADAVHLEDGGNDYEDHNNSHHQNHHNHDATGLAATIPNNEDLRLTAYDHDSIVRVLIPITVIGWLMLGLISVLCINGRSRAGRYWVPEWYSGSGRAGTARLRARLAMWYVGVVVFWPLTLPVMVLCLLKGNYEEKRLLTRAREYS